MRSRIKFLLVGLTCSLTAIGAALADTKVELKGVHLCCGACVKGVGKALAGVEGVKAKCDQEAGAVTITADSDAAAGKALAALGAAGYYGETGNAKLSVPAAKAPEGTVTSVTVDGIHNCCRSCCVAIKDAVKTVKGVKSDTAAPKATKFEVTGEFQAADLVKALNAAGFQVKVSH